MLIPVIRRFVGLNDTSVDLKRSRSLSTSDQLRPFAGNFATSLMSGLPAGLLGNQKSLVVT
jgi:hypothetical protein